MNSNWNQQQQHPSYMAYHQGPNQAQATSDVTYYNHQGQPIAQAPSSYGNTSHQPPPPAAPMPYSNQHQQQQQVCYNAYGAPPPTNTTQAPPPPPPPPPFYGNSNYSHAAAYPPPQSNHSYNPNYYSQVPTHTNSQSIPPHPQVIQQQPFHPVSQPPQKDTSKNQRPNKPTSKPTPTKHNNHPPKKSPYWCQSCKITFSTPSALSAHTSSHIQCHDPNCTFEGSKKVVSAHYAQQHGTYSGRGLKSIALEIPGTQQVQTFRICVGNHPQDIQAWIEERKRKFPTKQRILEKEEQKRKNTKRKRLEVGLGVSESNTSQDGETKQDQGNEKDQLDPTSRKGPESSLANLMAGYGSSDEEASTQDQEVPTQSEEKDVTESVQETVATTLNSVEASESKTHFKFKKGHCRHFIRKGTCKHGDSCSYIHDLKEREEFKACRMNQIEKKRAKRKEDVEKEVIRNGTSKRTLLRGLLQNDIQRERSLTLQLLRYIVDCNYLQSQRENKESDCDKTISST